MRRGWPKAPQNHLLDAKKVVLNTYGQSMTGEPFRVGSSYRKSSSKKKSVQITDSCILHNYRNYQILYFRYFLME